MPDGAYFSQLMAQARQPIRIFTGEAEPPPTDWAAIGSVVGVIMALSALIAIVVLAARRRLNARAPDEAAFLTLARRMRLSRADRALLRELSLKAGLSSPVAPMVSRGAFEQLLQAAVGRGAPIESIKRVRSLGQRLRWVAEGQVEVKPEAGPAKKPAPAKGIVAVPARPRPASVPGGTRRGPSQR
ncbi:MAG: hypothetical protein IT436_07570 [Phycisphaerales bacterium]|nr:hypothetical protein [Phycisphaerales bacterium]